MSRKHRIVISGIYYPLAIGKYIEAAFRRRDDVELLTAGPYTGNYIPWAGGMTMPAKHSRPPDISLPHDFIGTSPLSACVSSRLPWVPDLWIQIDAGFHFMDRPNANMVAHIGTDPHVLLKQYKLAKAYSDMCFGMQGPYMEPRDIYLPYAADPIWHSPLSVEKEWDCSLIGLHYEQRDRLVDKLRSGGLRVYYNLGPIFEEYRLLNSKAKVILSWSSLQDTPARVYEGMLMGALVCNRTPDLTGMFVEGDHYLGFDTVEEAEKQVRKLLSDDNMREEMHERSHRKVFAQHLWDHRVEVIMDKCFGTLSHDTEKTSIRLGT